MARHPHKGAQRTCEGCSRPWQAFWGCDGLRRGSAAAAVLSRVKRWPGVSMAGGLSGNGTS